MQDEQWENLIDNLEIKFGKLERKKQTTSSIDDVGNKTKNEEEWLEFETPMGEMKLSRVVRPMIIDKKFHYTHGSGGKGKVEYIVSDTEKSHKVTLYKRDDLNNDWQEVQTPGGDLRF